MRFLAFFFNFKALLFFILGSFKYVFALEHRVSLPSEESTSGSYHTRDLESGLVQEQGLRPLATCIRVIRQILHKGRGLIIRLKLLHRVALWPESRFAMRKEDDLFVDLGAIKTKLRRKLRATGQRYVSPPSIYIEITQKGHFTGKQLGTRTLPPEPCGENLRKWILTKEALLPDRPESLRSRNNHLLGPSCLSVNPEPKLVPLPSESVPSSLGLADPPKTGLSHLELGALHV